MKKIVTLLVMAVTAILVTQCATGPVGGYIYTGTKFAGEVNPANDVPAEKTAEGCEKQVLGLFTWGDAGAGEIAKANGIKRIASIDHSTTTVLAFLYRDYCSIVRGK